MQFRKRVAWLVGLLAVSAVALAGCGAKQAGTQQPKGPVAITIQLPADPPNLDPHLSSALVDRQVQNNIFDKLVEIDENLNIVPELAESWTISEDGKDYTFKLRQGVKFHDGTDFNAEAVKFNIERMLDPNLASPRKNEVSLVDSVTVVDTYTVKITLKQAFSPFLGILSDRAGMIVSPAAVQKYGADFANNPVGTGPFKFVSRVKGDSITLAKNESYWKSGLPKADQVTFKILTDENVALVNLQSGQIDVLTGVPAKDMANLENDKRVVLYTKPGIGYQGLWLNVTQPPFDNKKVRQAVASAIDSKTIIDVVFAGRATPATGPFPPNSPYFDGTEPPARDVAKAKALLAESGVKDLSFTLSITPSPVNQQLAQVLQNMLQEVGFTVNIEQIEWGQLLDKMDKLTYQATPVGWSGRAEPDQNIYAFFYTDGGFNNSGYSNPEVDRLLDESRAKNGLDRKPVYADVLRIIREDVPYVYLYHPLNAMATNPALTGFVLYPDGMVRAETIGK